MRRNYLRVGTLVKQKGRSDWGNPHKLLRVVKRKNSRNSWAVRYFVVGVGDAYGHGIWTIQDKLLTLTPLELLAMEAEDCQQ